ncbi:hypothetical protein RB620_22705 [Paenibacillus sp. LHD-117]|uniref:hypothetical protein n=1 Tax=Paenibacillus sp. LHD-117 TaxID=3071412 RepID=UPI0027DFD405|nr:hypothetical protein [Paenibacillus sp. LHD-117]MDQ6422242.1 hypothetical protein [Paenibacillus sp. LHD-117]
MMLVICFLFSSSTVIADSSLSEARTSNTDTRVFRLTANEVLSAHVKWGPGIRWMLTRNEIDSLITILRKAMKEDIKPYHGPFPKGGPFQVSLTTKSYEQYTFTVGAGGEGYVLYSGGKVFLPEFTDFMKPFIIRRANEAKPYRKEDLANGTR